jgi:hypothetical protein
MKTMLIGLLFATSLISLYTTPASIDSRVFFESDLLAFADGKSYGVNADHIGMTLQLIHELGKMLDGEKTAVGHVGIFTFQETRHTTKSLRALEASYDAELIEIHGMHVDKNNATAMKSKKQREESCIQKQALLQVYLDEVKKYFNTKVTPFMSYAHGMKDIIHELISESCRKRNRNDSFMLTWGECEEGKETEKLHKGITTFKALDLLVLDLVNFLKDFVHSCPKARVLFIELVKQKKNSPETPSTSSKKDDSPTH